MEEGKVITEPSAVFNDYFSKPVVVDSILNMSEQDFVNHMSVKWITNHCYDFNFSFQQVNTVYITDLLSNLIERKSTGPDGISPKLLRISASVIAEPLANLFNYCITKCAWPSEWKCGDVTPAHKKEEVTNKKNYRPITILSAIPKLFEKVKFEQLYEKFAPNILGKNVGFSPRSFMCHSSSQVDR